MKSVVRAVVFSCAAISAVQVMAHEEGEFFIRAGATMVEPRESSALLTLNGNVLALGGKPSALGVDSSTQLGLNVGYMLSNNVSVELLAATPFRHDAYGTGALAGLKIAEAKQLPPTLSLNYHLPLAGAFVPYVGVGVNYTVFFDEDITAQAATTLSSLGLNQGDLSLDDSTGLSVQAGADYHLANNLLLNASVRWIDIDTEAKIKFNSGSVLKADVEIDPLVYTLALGVAF
jgi:outer membrane protein